MSKFAKQPLPNILGFAENQVSSVAKPIARARSAKMDNLMSAINSSPEFEPDNLLAPVKEAMAKSKTTP